jgi:hypothetical protein
MTTYITTDTFTGSNGASWSGTNWTALTAINTTAASATIQGNKGRLNAGSVTGFGGKMAMRYAGGTLAAAEFIGKVTFTTSIDGGLEVWLRANTGSPDGTGYFLRINIGTGTSAVYIGKGVSFSYSTLLAATFTIAQNTEYGFRFYASGTTLKAKIWATSGSEPSSYTISTTDSSISAAGYAYLAATGGNSANMLVDVDDVQLTDGTGNSFTYTGSITAGPGVFSRGTVTKVPFTGSVTASGVLNKLKVVVKGFTGSITPSGVLLRLPIKIVNGSVVATGNLLKVIPKTLAASITSSGVFRKSFVRKFTGTITTVGTPTIAFAGRIFGRPGIVRVTVEKAAEVRLRIRRG